MHSSSAARGRPPDIGPDAVARPARPGGFSGAAQYHPGIPGVSGRSITDACLPLDETLPLLERLAEAQAQRDAGQLGIADV